MNQLLGLLAAGILPGMGGAEGGAEGASGGGGGPMQLVLLLGVFVLFYFLLIFPESRRRKKLQAKIKAMKKGDKVVTTGGIVGIIEFVAESEKTVRIKTLDSKIEIAKDFIATVLDGTEEQTK